MAYIPYTVPNLPDYKKSILENFASRMNVFFERALVAYPNYQVGQIIWYPQAWSVSGNKDYRFKRGRIPKNLPPLNQTFSEIFDKSVFTQNGIDCHTNLVVTNGKSLTPRTCVVPCTDLSYNTDFSTGLTSELRWVLLGGETIINCTNHTPEEKFAVWTPICTYEKQQVDALFEMRDTPEFQIIRFNYLDKSNRICPLFFIIFLMFFFELIPYFFF